jgi:hypothetical protein
MFSTLSLAVPARAAGLLDAPLSYSATRTVTVDGKPYTGPIYHAPGRERHQQNLMGMDAYFILDDQANKALFVIPGIKTFVSSPFPPLLSTILENDLTKTPVGDETIDHIPVTKYRIDKTASDGTHGDGFAWISNRGVLMKLLGTITASNGHKNKIDMQLSNVKEAPQKPELFAVPVGMTEMPAEAVAPLLGGILR